MNTADTWGATFAIEEFFHAMFGGNEWHLGRSAALKHTFASPVNAWGICGQTSSGIQSNIVSGWDRQHLNWKNPLNTIITSARDGLTGNEVDTRLNILTNPNSSTDGTYVLRDFVSSGDALQIKLPHIHFQNLFDKKNQYLWVENHQMINPMDHDWNYLYHNLKCGLLPPPCGNHWQPGIHCQIQVGKDHTLDSQYPYPLFDYSGGGGPQPNSTASWMFPLTAAGNYDYVFTPPYSGTAPCSYNIPLYDISNPETKPNPLTGYNEAFGIPNSEPDDRIWPPLPYPPDVGAGPGILLSGNVYWPQNNTGGNQTAFNCNGPCPALGKKILSLSTNPAPLPVYTYQSHGFTTLANIGSWDNRQIWLNGLSITLLEENFQPGTYGAGAMLVKVRWDDYDIENDVRWCGDIILSPNDFNTADPSLNIINNSTLLLDRGYSPTRMDAIVQINGEWVFTEPTILTCLPQSFINVESGSEIIVDNGSSLYLQNQSKLILDPNSQIIVRNNSKLILESGSYLELNGGARVIIEEGSTIEYYPNANISINGVQSCLEIAGMLDIKDNADFTFTYSTNLHGYILFNSPLNLPLNIQAGINCTITLDGTNQTRKVLEVQQEGFYPPSNLISFYVQDGSIVLHPQTRVLPLGWQTTIGLENVRLTSNTPGVNNGHLGFQMVGQYHTVTNSIFEYGKYGIHYIATLGRNDFYASNCVFRYCEEGLYTDDKGAHLDVCHFFDNSVAGWNTGIMSNPSRLISGTVGGSLANANYQGIYYYAGNTATLTVNDPNITYNNTSGVQVERTTLIPRCGTISYNTDQGIIVGKSATLQMDNGANVTCVGNGISIGLNLANYFYLYKGQNDLTPLQPQTQTAVSGTLVAPGPYPIVADENKWNNSGTIGPNDYSVDYLGIPRVITDINPQSLISPCGKANPPPPPAPGGPGDPLTNCNDCDVLNTEDFTNTKLNEATLEALEKTLEISSTNYIEAVNLFSQILLEDYINPTSKEVYLLSLNYLKMLDAIGNAVSSGQLTWQENSSTISPVTQMVVEALNKLIDLSITNNDQAARYVYNLDKASVYRLVDRRDLALNVLNLTSPWTTSENMEELDLLICIYNMEHQALAGTLLPINLSSALDNCGSLNSASRQIQDISQAENKFNNFDLFLEVWPNPSSGIVQIHSNIKEGRIILKNPVGEKIYSMGFSIICQVNTGGIPKGVYSLEVIDEVTHRTSVKKLIIQ